MDKQEADIQRGEEASRILNSPLWRSAFDDTRMGLLNALASLDSIHDDRAPEIHAMVKALDKVELCIRAHVSTGKIASLAAEKAAKGSFLRRA